MSHFPTSWKMEMKSQNWPKNQFCTNSKYVTFSKFSFIVKQPEKQREERVWVRADYPIKSAFAFLCEESWCLISLDQQKSKQKQKHTPVTPPHIQFNLASAKKSTSRRAAIFSRRIQLIKNVGFFGSADDASESEALKKH